MVQSYRLVEDYDPGAGAETKEWDLPKEKTHVIKALIYDIAAQRAGGSDPTREVVAAELDEITIGVHESPSISVIDGEDLHNENILFGNRPIWDAGGADNSRASLGFVQALDPFMIQPQIDYNQPYGLPGEIAGKLKVKFGADGTGVDGKKLTVGIITKPKSDLGSIQGYMTHHKHTDTMAVGTAKSYAVPQPGKLLGVHFFETTGFHDITTDGDYRSTQTIREASITIGEKVIQGALPTTSFGILNGADCTELTDQGHSLWNFGIHNKLGNLGVPTKGRIPADMKVKVLGGAADAMRLYAITLNDKLTK